MNVWIASHLFIKNPGFNFFVFIITIRLIFKRFFYWKLLTLIFFFSHLKCYCIWKSSIILLKEKTQRHFAFYFLIEIFTILIAYFWFNNLVINAFKIIYYFVYNKFLNVKYYSFTEIKDSSNTIINSNLKISSNINSYLKIITWIVI